ncbi:MAG: molybdopterin-dependent oxidoreductase [Sphingobium sp.]|nr:molybdopterin-dependent oxidoreductase [Sphingobium sp.]
MTVIRTICTGCGVGCGIRATVGEGREARIEGDRMHPANQGRLCPLGAALGQDVGLEERLLHPEVGGKRVTWDKAIGHVARRLGDLIARHGPDSIAFHVSGDLPTEDIYVANKLMKGYIGAANIDGDAPAGTADIVAAHVRTFGEDVQPASFEDVDRADLIVLIGGTLMESHPILHQRIMIAHSERSCGLVMIGGQEESECDLHLPVRPGSEGALMKGLLVFCDRAGVIDQRFLENSVAVSESFWRGVRDGHDLWSVARACGVAPALLKRFYEMFTAQSRTVTMFGPDRAGVSRGDDSAQAILNIHLATGRIGKPGAGPFALTGQANGMGWREVGASATTLAAHMDFAPDNVARVRRFWAAPAMATGPGVGGSALFEHVREGRIRALWIMGDDPVATRPDGEAVAEALAACPLVIHSHWRADSATGRHAHVRLPAAAWNERDGTLTSADRLISRQRALFPLPGEARPDWWMLTRVARAMGWRESFPYDRAADIYREHARLSAYQNGGAGGRERLFNLRRHASISNPAYDQLTPWRWGEIPFDGGRFSTPDGRARLGPAVESDRAP